MLGFLKRGRSGRGGRKGLINGGGSERALAAIEEGKRAEAGERTGQDEFADSIEMQQMLRRLEATDLENDEVAERVLGGYRFAKVLTAPDGKIRLSEAFQRAVCALDNGIVMYCASVEVAPQAFAYVTSEMERSELAQVGTVFRVSEKFLADFYRSRGKLHEQMNARDMSRQEERLHEILDEAAGLRASDVHFIVDRVRGIFRMRVDGSLTDEKDTSRMEMEKLSLLAYHLADDSEGGQRDPNSQQAARWSGAKARLPLGVDGLRLQWMPLAGGGQQLVARLFYMESAAENRDVDSLGYTRGQVRMFRNMRRQPFGMVVISGVTGSGKSTTLAKTLLAQLRERPGINLMTVEDPPEYRIPGARQVPVTASIRAESGSRAGQFSAAISGVLRSDPDVIMVGEIRDADSAKLGVEAVLTGHQMWTTVHAINVVLSLQRLLEMGLEEAVLLDKSVVTGLVSQRLVPQLCPQCSVPFSEPLDRFRDREDFRQQLERLFEDVPARAVRGIRVRNTSVPETGCGQNGCRSGYLGRSVVAEVLQPDATFMSEYRTKGAREAEAAWLEREDSVRKVEHGALKVLAGQMDPVDVEESVGMLDGFRAEHSSRWSAVFRLAAEEDMVPELREKPVREATGGTVVGLSVMDD